MTVTPYAVAVFVLLACILVGTWPGWRSRRRHTHLSRERAARAAEDRAWLRREEEATLARRIRFARYEALTEQLETHSLAAPDQEFALGLGEIDGGGA